MRIVNSRKKVWDKDYAFVNKFTLLVWILSVIKWKELGHTTVLYTDKETLGKMKEIGFDSLYDEIDTEYLENEQNIKDIDFWCFWAMPKILSLKAEIEKGYTSLISDTDVVPIQDITKLVKNTDLTVWSNKEYTELKSIYPNLENLSLPENYKFPYWFKGTARPLNTGVIYFRDNQNALEYIKEVIRISKNNHNHKRNTRSQTMCNAEQRMIGEYVRYKGLSYNVIQPLNEGLFNKYAFHTHGYKVQLKEDEKFLYNVNFLIAIKKHKPAIYSNLVRHKMFEKEKVFIESKYRGSTYLKDLSGYEDL